MPTKNIRVAYDVVYRSQGGYRTIVVLHKDLETALRLAQEWWRRQAAAIVPRERGRLTLQRCIDEVVQPVAQLDDSGWHPAGSGAGVTSTGAAAGAHVELAEMPLC